MTYPSNTDTYSVTAHELKQFYERLDQLEDEKKDIAEQIKELYAEIKGRGYQTKIVRIHRKERKIRPDVRAEQDAILELYREALGDV